MKQAKGTLGKHRIYIGSAMWRSSLYHCIISFLIFLLREKERESFPFLIPSSTLISLGLHTHPSNPDYPLLR